MIVQCFHFQHANRFDSYQTVGPGTPAATLGLMPSPIHHPNAPCFYGWRYFRPSRLWDGVAPTLKNLSLRMKCLQVPPPARNPPSVAGRRAHTDDRRAYGWHPLPAATDAVARHLSSPCPGHSFVDRLRSSDPNADTPPQRTASSPFCGLLAWLLARRSSGGSREAGNTCNIIASTMVLL